MQTLIRPAALCLLSFFLVAGTLHAQDTLYKADGSKSVVKITGVNASQVMYSVGYDENGTVHVISRDALSKIVYSTGLVDSMPLIPSPPTGASMKQPMRKIESSGCLVTFNLSDFFYGTVSFAFEYIFRSALSIKVPVSASSGTLGLSKQSNQNDFESQDYYNRNKIFGTGLEINLYPTPARAIRYFVGPSFEYGRMNSWRTVYSSYNYSYTEKVQSDYFSISGENGVLFQPMKHFIIVASVGVGISRLSRKYDVYYNGTPSREDARVEGLWRFGLSFGYKF